MKKKNEYVIYCCGLFLFAVMTLVMALAAEDIGGRIMLSVICFLSSVTFGVCLSCARQVYYYNKAMDAWANFQAEMKKRECMQVSQKIELPFEEFDFEQDE